MLDEKFVAFLDSDVVIAPAKIHFVKSLQPFSLSTSCEIKGSR